MSRLGERVAGALLLFGLLLGGALSAPTPTSSVTVHTRSASCAGSAFYPTDSVTSYGNVGTLRVLNGATGSGVFRCDPGLPNGATVTRVQFTVRMAAPYGGNAGGIGDCALRRSGLTVSTAATAQDLGRVLFGSVNVAPGPVRLTDKTIINATINNASFGYWLECAFTSSGFDNIGIYGANVIYTITAANG